MNTLEGALRRAAEFRLISLLLERPRTEMRSAITALAGELGDSGAAALARSAAEIDESQYVALLGPGGPVSPREAAYAGRRDPGWILADASAFYDAFGYRPRREDPLDHVAVECGFAGYLWLKEAHALLQEDAEAAAGAARARQRFEEEHLSPLAGALALRLADVGAWPLDAVARLLHERTGGVAPSKSVSEEEGGMTCGSCTSGDRKDP
jgi:nitrate reductase assembly molybdenum cofactor insertion protein NarJ